MDPQHEQERARALAFARDRQRHHSTKSPSDKLSNVREQLEYYSNKLISTTEAKDVDASLKLVEKIIDLKARQLVHHLEHEKLTYDEFDTNEIQNMIQSFNNQCIALALSVDQLLGI